MSDEFKAVTITKVDTGILSKPNWSVQFGDSSTEFRFVGVELHEVMQGLASWVFLNAILSNVPKE